MLDDEIKKELKELQKQIVFFYKDPVGQKDITPRVMLGAWEERFGKRSPKEIYNILSYDAGETTLKLPLDEPRNIELLHGSETDYCKTKLVVDALPDTDTITLARMDVHGKRGAGTARKILANVYTMIETQFPQIETINVVARETGAYAWARFGFVPDARQDERQEHWWAQKNKISEQLTPRENETIEKIIASDDPKSIWLLADMNKPIHNPNTEQETTLGKYLLIGTSWVGKLDLRDKEAVDRFKGYIAKLDIKRTISGAEQGATTPGL